MDNNIKEYIKIRSKVLFNLTKTIEAPVDMLFYFVNGKAGMSPIPIEGDFPPSHKYMARKRILQALVSDSANPKLKNTERMIYFSIDYVYDVDYCFEINKSRHVTLYIIKDGNIIRRYKDYDISYDERQDIALI